MQQPPLRIAVRSGGSRGDRLVADATGAGRRAVRRWFEAGLVRLGDRALAASEALAPGDEVTVWPEAEGGSAGVGGIVILQEGPRHVVLAKPAGLHSERGRSGGCVADFLEERYGDRSAVGDRPAEGGLAHRLDRDTSGVLVAARDRDEYLRLRRAFAEGKAGKQYLALVSGRLEEPTAVDTPLAGRGPRMAAAGPRDRALPATTLVAPLEAGSGWSLVLVTMATGVRHQIRAHLAIAGHPLVGDGLYGGPALPGARRNGHLLHALRLTVGPDIDVTAPVPGDFLQALALVRRRGAAAMAGWPQPPRDD